MSLLIPTRLARMTPPRASGPSELPAITGVSGFTLANTAISRAAKAAMLAGTSDMRVAYIGDSTVFGQNSIGTATTGAKSKSVTMQLADLLEAASIPASSDDMWGLGEAGTPSATMANFLLAETRATRSGTGWTNQSFPVIGGKSWGVAGANTTDTNSFVTNRAVNRCDVYYLRFSSGGNFRFRVDGGTESGDRSTAIPPTNGMDVHTLDLGTNATHTLTLRCADANVFLIGLVFYSTVTKRIVLMNQGACGYTTAQIGATTAAWDWGNQIANANMGLKLAIIQGGLVNDRAATADPTTPMSRIQTWITAFQAAGTEVWLVNPEPVSDSTTISFAYRDALAALAVANNCPCINFLDPYSGVTAWEAAGHGDGVDHIHPDQSGYGYIAGRYSSMFQAL